MDTFFYKISRDVETAAEDPAVRRRARCLNRATAACVAGAVLQLPLLLHADRRLDLSAGALTVLTAAAVAAAAVDAAYTGRGRFDLLRWLATAVLAGFAVGFWWDLCPWDRAVPLRQLLPLLLSAVVAAMVAAHERRR